MKNYQINLKKKYLKLGLKKSQILYITPILEKLVIKDFYQEGYLIYILQY